VTGGRPDPGDSVDAVLLWMFGFVAGLMVGGFFTVVFVA
jgi:hypothetical protein